MHARVVGNLSKSLKAWAELRDSNDKARAIEVWWQGVPVMAAVLGRADNGCSPPDRCLHQWEEN